MQISIIITTYNSPEYLRRVLEGYADQTVLPLEIIVADDGSTEDTAVVVRSVAAKLPIPVKHVWHEDAGFRAAKIRNEAVKAAEGEYIVFTDGDCIPSRYFVADHGYHARPSHFIQGKRMLVGEQLSQHYMRGSFWNDLRYCTQGLLSGCHHLLRFRDVTFVKQGLRGIRSCNMGVYKKDILTINGFNESFIGWGREDSDFAFRLMQAGVIRRDPVFSAIVYHLWHQENSRDALQSNDTLLQQTFLAGSYRCTDGIVKG